MWPFNLLPLLSVFISLCTILVVHILYFAVYSRTDKNNNVCFTRTGKQTCRLGFFERYFFDVAIDGSNTAYINTVLLLESKVKLDQDHVKKALPIILLLERFPLLRIREAVDWLNQPWFEEMESPGPNLDFRYMSQIDATQWLHVFQEQINGVSFNIEQGPLWRVALLREGSGVAEQGNLYKNSLYYFSSRYQWCSFCSSTAK